MNFKRRGDLALHFNDMGFAVGAEVGVYEGDFSRFILANVSSVKTLYSIDPWMTMSGDLASDIHEKCVKNLAEFGARSKIIVSSSPGVAATFGDSSLDFVYIDADHSYKATKADLAAWWPKVRPGGIFSGHDYKDRGMASIRNFKSVGRHCRVKQAVNEFAAALNLEVHATHKDRPPSWWIVKPNN